MNVILPQQTRGQVGMRGTNTDGPHPVLWLLHGWSDDHTIWMRRTSVERYVAPLGLAVVMPAVDKSYYCNMAFGPRYWDFVSEELPTLARSFFPLSERREDNYVAGLSMGGYGAVKLAFSFPERYAAAGTFSGAVRRDWGPAKPDDPHYLVFGDQPPGAVGNDVYALAAQARERSPAALPRIYQSCGTEDFLYRDNLRFREHLLSLDYDLTSDFRTGDHEWGFWDNDVQRFLAWLEVS
jgi:S-formylglutathione hydrolase FrmB